MPVIDGEANFFRKVETQEYILKRFSLIGVVDRYSKARVYILSRSDTSYSDVRLLEKAINKLGKPEIIKGDNGKNYLVTPEKLLSLSVSLPKPVSTSN